MPAGLLFGAWRSKLHELHRGELRLAAQFMRGVPSRLLFATLGRPELHSVSAGQDEPRQRHEPGGVLSVQPWDLRVGIWGVPAMPRGQHERKRCKLVHPLRAWHVEQRECVRLLSVRCQLLRRGIQHHSLHALRVRSWLRAGLCLLHLLRARHLCLWPRRRLLCLSHRYVRALQRLARTLPALWSGFPVPRWQCNADGRVPRGMVVSGRALYGAGTVHSRDRLWHAQCDVVPAVPHRRLLARIWQHELRALSGRQLLQLPRQRCVLGVRGWLLFSTRRDKLHALRRRELFSSTGRSVAGLVPALRGGLLFASKLDVVLLVSRRQLL